MLSGPAGREGMEGGEGAERAVVGAKNLLGRGGNGATARKTAGSPPTRLRSRGQDGWGDVSREPRWEVTSTGGAARSRRALLAVARPWASLSTWETLGGLELRGQGSSRHWEGHSWPPRGREQRNGSGGFGGGGGEWRGVGSCWYVLRDVAGFADGLQRPRWGQRGRCCYRW